MRRKLLVGVLLAGAVVAGAAVWVRHAGARSMEPGGGAHSAVLLSNGQVYYGKLEGLGTPFPVLRDVYYVQVGVKPDSRETANVLLKRGREWHAPDRMVLNANHILLVEPVSKGSRVSSLIAEFPK
jgi:hypothetical protein